MGAVYRWLIQWLFSTQRASNAAWCRHGVVCIKGTLWIDSSIPNDALMRPSIIQWMFQIMACRLIGTKTISELMLICASIEVFRTHFSKISIEIHKFSVRKTCFKMPVQWRPFCLGCSMCWVCLCANIGIICNRISCSPANNVVGRFHWHVSQWVAKWIIRWQSISFNRNYTRCHRTIALPIIYVIKDNIVSFRQCRIR